jgi:hypothetical protein
MGWPIESARSTSGPSFAGLAAEAARGGDALSTSSDEAGSVGLRRCSLSGSPLPSNSEGYMPNVENYSQTGCGCTRRVGVQRDLPAHVHPHSFVQRWLATDPVLAKRKADAYLTAIENLRDNAQSLRRLARFRKVYRGSDPLRWTLFERASEMLLHKTRRSFWRRVSFRVSLRWQKAEN